MRGAAICPKSNAKEWTGQFKGFRLKAGHFLESNQRNGGVGPGLTGRIVDAGIFRHAIHGVVEKRPASMPAALRVYD